MYTQNLHLRRKSHISSILTHTISFFNRVSWLKRLHAKIYSKALIRSSRIHLSIYICFTMQINVRIINIWDNKMRLLYHDNDPPANLIYVAEKGWQVIVYYNQTKPRLKNGSPRTTALTKTLIEKNCNFRYITLVTGTLKCHNR